MKMNEITEPLINRYSDLLDERIDTSLRAILNLWGKVTGKIESVKLAARTKARRLGFGYSGNIFNHFAYQWIVFHLPFKNVPLTQLDAFARAFPASIRQNPRFETYLNHFHKSAVEVWEKLKEPTIEEIRYSLLEIVAKGINKNLKLERETLGRALYDIFLVLLKKGEELITEENFIKLMKNYMGILWKDEREYSRACREFFYFSKHFLTIDFPASKRNNYILQANLAVQNKIARLHNRTLFLLEKKVDMLYSNFFGRKLHELDFIAGGTGEALSSFGANVRLRVVFCKLGAVIREGTRVSFSRLGNSWLGRNISEKVLNNKLVRKGIESFVDFQTRNALLIKENLLVPVFDKIRVLFHRSRNYVSVLINDIKTFDVKQILPKIQKRIFYLKDSMISFYEGGVEIRFSRQSFGRYSSKLREDMAYFCAEMRKCDIHTLSISFKTRGTQLYEKALESMKARRRARGKSPEWHMQDDLDSSRAIYSDDEPVVFHSGEVGELLVSKNFSKQI
jgi:hypothetical protein